LLRAQRIERVPLRFGQLATERGKAATEPR
jgi:hypothetical protein